MADHTEIGVVVLKHNLAKGTTAVAGRSVAYVGMGTGLGSATFHF